MEYLEGFLERILLMTNNGKNSKNHHVLTWTQFERKIIKLGLLCKFTTSASFCYTSAF